MRILETEVFHYSELSDSSKERARDWFRSAQDGNNLYAEDIYDYAAEIGAVIGIDLCQTRKMRKDGSPIYKPTIYYSGFCSQGDGACFESTYKYKNGSLKALKTHTDDEELLRICKALQDVQKRYFYRLHARTTHRGYYYHSGCMRVSVDYIDGETCKGEEEIAQALRDFADWIYRRLESAYYFENSDLNVAETIEANEYEFNINGDIV